jgi:hypothetical protein
MQPCEAACSDFYNTREQDAYCSIQGWSNILSGCCSSHGPILVVVAGFLGTENLDAG